MNGIYMNIEVLLYLEKEMLKDKNLVQSLILILQCFKRSIFPKDIYFSLFLFIMFINKYPIM